MHKKILIILLFLLWSVPASEILSEVEVFAQVDTAWVRRYNGPGNSNDIVTSIAVDSDENIYVTGYSYQDTSGWNYDYATIKYYPNGDTAWVRRYNGPGDVTDKAKAIAVDNSGNVYVTGYSGENDSHPTKNTTCATIKYFPNGDTAWVRLYKGPEDSSDAAVAIAIDGSGNVYVTGYGVQIEGYPYSLDYLTIKYHPNGDTAWVRRYSGPTSYWDEATAIAVDSSGNIYVTGMSGGDGTGYDYATVKYDANGNKLWIQRYNGPGNYWDKARSIAVDGSGNVYVTGESYGSGTDDDYATIKYVHTPPDFTIEVMPDTQVVQQGGYTNYLVILTPLYGFNSPCTLTVSGLPGGATGDFDPNPVVPTDTSVLTINTLVTTPEGEYTITITATEMTKGRIGIEHSTQVVLIVESATPTGTIEGLTTNAGTSVPIQGTLVEAMQDSLIIGSGYSEIDGNYNIPNLSAGFYNVRARKPGYETKTYNGVQVTDGQTTTQNFNLNPSPADTIFFDDFADGNADGWDTLTRACNWEVATGQYILTAPGEYRKWCISSKGDINLRDYIYEADVFGIHGVDKVIAFRYLDQDNFYAVNLRSDWEGNDEVTINKMHEEVFTADIVSVLYPSQNQTIYHLKVEVRGTYATNIKVWVDDNQLINWTDPDEPIPHGKIAVAAYSGDYGGDTGLPTVVWFGNILVACPSYDLDVDILEDEMQDMNDTTHWFVLPFSVENSGSAPVYDIDVNVDLAGQIFTHTIQSVNAAESETISDTINVPRVWEEQNGGKEIRVSITSVAGCPISVQDYKEVSIYYCEGGTDTHPFTIYRDFYSFPNPRPNWQEYREFVIETFPPLPALVPLLLSIFQSVFGIPDAEHCFGMSASSAAYFLDPSVKPIQEETRLMELSDDGVFQNIIRYQFAQFLFGEFYTSFVPTEPNNAEASAKNYITSNLPPLIALRRIVDYIPRGHAVTAYKLVRDHSDGKSILYLYDNEAPDEVNKVVFNLHDNTFQYDEWTGIRVDQPFILYSDEEWLDKLWDWLKSQISNLWDWGLARFGLGCPAKMLLTDEYGRRVGFVDGVTFVNEIPGAEVTFIDGSNGDTLSFYDVPVHLNYTVKYFGSDSGFMDAEVLKPISEETAITLSYVGVQVTQDMVATLLVDSTYEYTLKIDYDGNGTIDTIVDPTVDNLSPIPFDLIFPLDQETVFEYPLIFGWSTSSDLNGDTVFYQVYMDTDSTFSSADSSEVITDTSWTCSIPLHDSTTYFWKVAAFDNNGGMTFSEQTWTFFLVLPFMRGDANGDGAIDVADVMYLINYLFMGTSAPDPLQAGDANCDGTVDVGDVLYLINYLFIGGSPPGC